MAASLAALALFGPTTRAGAVGRAVGVAGGRLVDRDGRQVVLRGINAGGRSKLPPFLPFDPVPDFDSALASYADGLQAQGFNVARLLVIHEAGEPAPGVYDEAYLARVDAMVAALSARGIHIIIDAHQDLFSRRFHGDGFPDWTIPEKYRDREGAADRKVWNRGYFTAPVQASFDRLWDNRDGLQDRLAAFFAMLAERWRDNPMVIGFEPINEPMPGRRGLINYEGYHRELYGYYERVARAVQAADPAYLIFADICAIENTGTINTRRRRPEIPNLVLAPHYYDLGTFGASLAPGGDRWIMAKGIGRHLKLARNWNVPVLLTEYGVSPANPDAPIYIAKLYGIFDQQLLSGTFWEASRSELLWNFEDTSIFTPSGELRPNAAYLDRPYPRAVPGIITEFSFDPDTGRLELAWDEAPGASRPSELYLPPRIYRDDPKVVFSAGTGPFTFDPGDHVVMIMPDPGTRRVGVTP
jgi:endoglycosylceramidase